jgi:hypothetical protein
MEAVTGENSFPKCIHSANSKEHEKAILTPVNVRMDVRESNHKWICADSAHAEMCSRILAKPKQLPWLAGAVMSLSYR